MNDDLADFLAGSIHSIPDYPKPGIIFRDITTLLANGKAFAAAIDSLVGPWRNVEVAQVVGIEARGFVIAGAMALELGCGFTAVRKKGKLPRDTHSVTYELEYGRDEVEIHADALSKGDKVLLVDDLIATGGTAFAAVELMDRLEAEILEVGFIVDLPELGGSERLREKGIGVRTLVNFEGH